jgi:hypothetical protein
VSGIARPPRRPDDTLTTDQEVTPMHYLLLLTFRPGEGPEEGTPEFDAEMQEWGRINEEIKASGAMVSASGLHLDAATTVRTNGGEVTITDGPYAETKETLFSFYIIDVEDLDAATAFAAKMPAAAYGSVEIRPMVHYELP